MPGQRYESGHKLPKIVRIPSTLHHKICNLRYGALGYEMDAYEGMAKINLHSQSKLIITSVNQF